MKKSPWFRSWWLQFSKTVSREINKKNKLPSDYRSIKEHNSRSETNRKNVVDFSQPHGCGRWATAESSAMAIFKNMSEDWKHTCAKAYRAEPSWPELSGASGNVPYGSSVTLSPQSSTLPLQYCAQVSGDRTHFPVLTIRVTVVVIFG